MFAKQTVQFPTLGYWPGFKSVATAGVNAFTGPYTALAGLRGCGTGGSCTGDPLTLGALFDSGLDLSGWGFGEWGIVGLGAYLLVTSFLTTKRGVSRIRKSGAARASRARRRASLQRQLKEL